MTVRRFNKPFRTIRNIDGTAYGSLLSRLYQKSGIFD
jgi:hypothetical protein